MNAHTRNYADTQIQWLQHITAQSNGTSFRPVSFTGWQVPMETGGLRFRVGVGDKAHAMASWSFSSCCFSVWSPPAVTNTFLKVCSDGKPELPCFTHGELCPSSELSRNSSPVLCNGVRVSRFLFIFELDGNGEVSCTNAIVPASDWEDDWKCYTTGQLKAACLSNVNQALQFP